MQDLDFFNLWKERYLQGHANYGHIERLKKIGRLTNDEFTQIIVAKKLKGVSKRGVR